MPRPSRARRIFKWTGAGLSLLTAATWTFSLWCYARVVFKGNQTYLGLGDGTVGVVVTDYDVKRAYGINTGIEFHQRGGFGFVSPGVMSVGGTMNTDTLILPFWLLLLLTAIPTAWLWHRDRRLFSSPPDHLICRGCGYDLTGNTSGVCSECGETTETAKR